MLPDAVTPAIEAVAPVTRRFAAAGHRLYLVGGIVRDLLAGRPVRRQDLDLTTDAEPSVVKELVAPVSSSLWTQGERFGTIGCIVEGQDLEITTHRAERYSGETRKPTVEFSDDVVADLSRRDFTINAIAIEVTSETPRLIDPFDGAGDLDARVLRTPIDPVVSFSDDPLRMLRAARFVAGFGLRPTDELTAAVADMGDRMSIVSRERIRDELVKLLALPDPTAGLDFLVRTGLLGIVLPDVAVKGDLDDRGGCHANARDHMVEVVALVPASPAGRTSRLVELLVAPSALAPDPGASDDGLGGRLRSLRFSNEESAAASRVAGAQPALDAAIRSGASPDLRRLAVAARDHLDAVLELARAEARARAAVDDGALAGRVEQVAMGLAELAEVEDLRAIAPAVDGAAVMSTLGIAPGPDVGAALGYLAERRLECGPRAAAAELDDVAAWWSRRASGAADRSDADVP